ncbi:cysteine hydrolase [Aquincola sp. S2]|uniref:Cysteine hydrolase n=1 Tax=Pseudaquabacterium terrae TaxID=2732868 RepID=A0ABX2EU77_9BURK|nr:cysteine hydrolase [Aquabacterium terrae]NRF72040.1 cysteine hydrolase [Aquabacterium terrae]
MSRRSHLLIIDPQNDFCDLPAAGPEQTPALPVAGADADMQRLARLIDAAAPMLDAITVTLDSHHRLDIAHPGFWRLRDGGPVMPFTPITAADVRAGSFAPRDPDALPRTLAYLDELEARGRYTLMVWPVHCEIGSWGHNVHADVRAAYNRWELSRQQSVAKVLKGSNPWTEHYSAVQAEVPAPDDEGTQLNRALLEDLDRAELILIAGEASSHCVKATTEHIVEHLPGGRPERLVLLTDCMSPVGGFEAQAEGFLADMKARGVRLATSIEAAALLSNR